MDGRCRDSLDEYLEGEEKFEEHTYERVSNYVTKNIHSKGRQGHSTPALLLMLHQSAV